MLSVAGYLVLIFAALITGETLNETELLSKCKSEKTFGYTYNTFYHIEEQHISSDGVTIRFYVKARSDAHILLSSKPYPSDDDPVYEIVLGAGRNTFSDIRRSKRSRTQYTATTQNILSGSEYKEFWIIVSHNGIISVGEGNNNLPLLFWQDSDPLVIRYFSFCTWAGVAGIWMFDCSSDANGEEVTVVEENLLPVERLRRDLLTHYDPFVRPTKDDEPTIVSVHLTSHHIILNEKKGIITVLGKMLLQWTDQKLKWNASDYNGLSQLHIAHHEVWLPDLILYNTATPSSNILDGTMLLATKYGSIWWEAQAKLTAWCSLDLSSWPQDMQRCSLELGFLSQEQGVKLLLTDNATTLGEQKTHSEWDVVQLETELTWARSPWITSNSENDDNDNEDEDTRFSEVPDTALKITFTLQRHAQTYNVIVTVPFLVTCTMTLMSFWISPKDHIKLFISCIDLVLLSVILVTLEDIIPASADHTPYLVTMYSWSMLSTGISLITSVLVICLVRYPRPQQLPELLWNIISSPITRMILCLPEQDLEDSENYTQLIENSTPAHSSSKPSIQGTQHQWILLATLIDRICFIAYLMFFSVILLNY